MQDIISLYDLHQNKARLIEDRNYHSFVRAVNQDKLYLVFKENKKSWRFEDPVYIEVWDWNLTLTDTFKLEGERTWIQS
jgi:hypothetical protein